MGRDSEDVVELVGLLSGPTEDNETVQRGKPKQRTTPRPTHEKKIYIVPLTLVVVVVIMFFASNRLVLGVQGGEEVDAKNTTTTAYRDGKLVLQCPTYAPSTENVDDEDSEYLEDQPDCEDFVTGQYRKKKFDSWGQSFEAFKATLLDFKKQYFLPYLKTGDMIYESACGLGLNTYATLEILQEQGNISGLTVYGNEYLAENAARASNILETLVKKQPGVAIKNQVGTICHGDSSDLAFVPDNVFDLVFSGYISPLWNPLELNGTLNDQRREMHRLCGLSNGGDSEARLLVEEMQKRQEAWFSRWVESMIRIAKPGSPIIVEQVAPPLCRNPNDWGGVSQAFWSNGASQRQWDVDILSVSFVRFNENFGDKSRYHVFMRKNGITNN